MSYLHFGKTKYRFIRPRSFLHAAPHSLRPVALPLFEKEGLGELCLLIIQRLRYHADSLPDAANRGKSRNALSCSTAMLGGIESIIRLPMIHFLLQPLAVNERQVRTPEYMRWVGEILQ